MQGFRQYLKNQEAEINESMVILQGAYSSGVISGDYYSVLVKEVNGRKLMLDNISREYERTHKIWE